jgi:hypothetical protein
MTLRKDGVASASIQFYVAPIFTFYQLNDVVLNRKKVSRYLGEYKRIVKDNAYTTEQIQQMLQNADIRMRMILLLLTSSISREGVMPSYTVSLEELYTPSFDDLWKLKTTIKPQVDLDELAKKLKPGVDIDTIRQLFELMKEGGAGTNTGASVDTNKDNPKTYQYK